MSAFDDLVSAVLTEVKARLAAASAWEIATVVAVNDLGVATVDWRGARIQVGRGASYTPAVGDVVWMARKGASFMLVDRYVAGPELTTGIEGVLPA